MNEQIRVSEIFHSVQGEGNTMGKPAVFLRLTGCNLLCGNPQAKGLKYKSQDEIYASQGENAEWTCDTISVWLKGEKQSTQDLAKHLALKYGKEFLNGSMLVITGGEPLMQQDQIPELVSSLRIHLRKNIRVEIETNGTVPPSDSLWWGGPNPIITQFNVSPKLSNSGMSKERRINEFAMQWFRNMALSDKALFKFVITKEDDLYEMKRDYIKPFDLPVDKIWLMPGCSNREQFEKVAPLVVEKCKEHGFLFSSRLQINLWNMVTGV